MHQVDHAGPKGRIQSPDVGGVNAAFTLGALDQLIHLGQRTQDETAFDAANAVTAYGLTTWTMQKAPNNK